MNTNGKEPIRINLSAGDVKSYKLDTDGNNEEISIGIPTLEGLLMKPLNSIFEVQKQAPVKQ